MGNILLSGNSLLRVKPSLQINRSALPYLQAVHELAHKQPPKNLVINPSQDKLRLLLPSDLRGKYLQVVGIYPITWIHEKQQTAIGCVVEAQRSRRYKIDGTILPRFIRHVWLNASAIDASPEQIDDAIAYAREDLRTDAQIVAQVALPLRSNFSYNIKCPEEQANNFASNSRADGDPSSRELFYHLAEQPAATQKQPVTAPKGIISPYPTFSARS